MASQASEISASGTNNASIGSFASKLSWNFNAFFYIDYPEKHLQAELGPKRRKTKGHRAYVCLHCQNPPWSNRVPGNAIHKVPINYTETHRSIDWCITHTLTSINLNPRRDQLPYIGDPG
ncbi:uncharacterized protein FPOAC1_013175 [Fusarium poae]|uniref:uncharacterized protein n=1 Tax=Fusarium poae TaxID=36050 RepID=UPI001D055658|nr:uncharacterized protein FPOAC1_013175 [Fusarium poae]KAG8665196.1 hypothetical protein FPOAC1_013175 [Fusarium poae]